MTVYYADKLNIIRRIKIKMTLSDSYSGKQHGYHLVSNTLVKTRAKCLWTTTINLWF